MATLLDGPCQFFLDFRRFVVMASRKLGIDASVMDLGTTFAIPVDRQFLPLAAQIEELQNIVEDLQQTQLRRRPTERCGKTNCSNNARPNCVGITCQRRLAAILALQKTGFYPIREHWLKIPLWRGFQA